MSHEVLLGLALVIGFYTCWNIGANDVANAIGTSVGSKSLTLRKAVVMAAILEFTGALLVGPEVSLTIQEGIVKSEYFADPMIVVHGMTASLLAAGFWLQIASYFGWPVSTTHTLVGAVIGFGVAIGGVEAVYWNQIYTIITSWIISPLMGAVIAYFAFSLLRKQIFYQVSPLEATRKIVPWLTGAVVFVLLFVLFFKGFHGLGLRLSLWETSPFILLLSGLSVLFSMRAVSKVEVTSQTRSLSEYQNPMLSRSLYGALKHLERAQMATTGTDHAQIEATLATVNALREKEDAKLPPDMHAEFSAVEKIFSYLQVFTAGCMAFAHGANDVGNAIGPLAAIVHRLEPSMMLSSTGYPLWLLLIGGSGIVLGLATWGWRVIETIGQKITELTPSRGFCAEFAAATTIMLASNLGLPISTTHTLVGAVLGIGFAGGIGALNLRTVRDIVASWLITVPIGALLAVIFYKGLALIA